LFSPAKPNQPSFITTNYNNLNNAVRQERMGGDNFWQGIIFERREEVNK
jgi:hypothetical protein